MVIIDPDSGTFLFARPRPGWQAGVLLTQLWAPTDYFTTGWDAVLDGDFPAEPASVVTVIAAWTIDAEGEESEVPLDPWGGDDDGATKEVIGEENMYDALEAGAHLTYLKKFPDGTPEGMRSAVTERESTRAKQWTK